jgi:tetratricopeptide (TPR) repeat protein
MLARQGILAVLLALGCLVQVQGAAPPARLTAAQAQQLRQRNRWLQRATTRHAGGQINEAIAAIDKALALERAVQGSVGSAALGWLAAQAQLQEQTEQFAQALRARQEVLRQRQQLHQVGNWRLTDARLDVEDCRLLARLDASARQRLRQAERWNAKVEHLWQQGKSREALPLAQKALAVRREILGENHRQTAQSWFNLAAQQHALYHLAEAERCSLKARDISKATLGQRHPDYATSLNDLGLLYQEMGEHKKALSLYQQALRIRKEVLGERHPAAAVSLNNLGLLYRDRGDYARARPLLEQARDLSKANLSEKHPLYATSLNNLATLYKAMGEYKKALSL